jgi:probable HAF family extracellular repeat protein
VDPYEQHVFRLRHGVQTDMGILPGGTSSCTQWINEHDVIVGGSTNGATDPLTDYPEVNAVEWEHGWIRNLGTLGGNESVAYAINNHGTVVGWALNSISDPFAFSVFAFGATQAHAVLWARGAMWDLGTLGGPDSAAYFVNESGQIAGQSLTNSIPNETTGFPTQDPFLWDRGKMTDLGSLGGTNGYPLSLNNRGQVIGQSNLKGDQTFHPFLWDRGVLTDLGTFGGDFGSANWMNDAREIVGWALYPGNQVFRPFRWKDGAMTDLGTVSGDDCGIAFGINSIGQVVGSSGDCQGNGLHAFLWNGDIVDLNSLVSPSSALQLKSATNINDRAEIAGTGVTPNGDQHAFLLIPCDDNHADVEGCDRSFVYTSPSGLAPRMSLSHAGNIAPTELSDRLRYGMKARRAILNSGSLKP